MIASDTNGTANGTPGKRKSRIQFGTNPKTAGYQPLPWIAGLSLTSNDRRIFTWNDVARMRTDPQIRMGLRILEAPLYAARWHIAADDNRVGKFVHHTFARVWLRALNKILKCFDFGHSCGEVTYAMERGRISFNRLHDFNPLDARPLRLRGKFVGARVYRVRGKAEVDIAPPNVLWCTHQVEHGALYGRSALEGAFEPWWERCARHGAKDIRKLWFLKNAFNGGAIRHPPGETEIGDGIYAKNEDIAQEIIEKLQTGGILVLPNTRDGLTKDYEWIYEPPQINGELRGVLDYVKMLDRETLIGMGIPPEILEAAEVGSGWSGRSVPFKVFFSTLDVILREIVEAIDRLIVRPLVEANFGRQAGSYEIAPVSLVEQAEEETISAKKETGDTKDSSAKTSDDGPMAQTRSAAQGKPQVRRLSKADFGDEFQGSRRLRREPKRGRRFIAVGSSTRLSTRQLCRVKPVRLSNFREDEHPRDDKGKFADKSDINAAKGGDKEAASRLRAAVTKPEERKKLDRIIGVVKDKGKEQSHVAIKLKPIKARAFAGAPVPVNNPISKQEAGRTGEAVVLAWLKSKGFADAGPMNTKQNNFPIDLFHDHATVEIKTGLVSNGPGAQQWRLTIGEPGAKEKAWLASASDEEKAKWNQKKQAMIHERKQKILTELSKEIGKPIKPKTITVLLNPDTKTADIYEFDGWHDRIGWNSDQAKAAYKTTVKYG